MEPSEYDTMAQLEDSYWWYLGVRRMVLRAVQLGLGKKPRLKILDAGCGTGGGMASLARRFPGSLIVGTDVAPAAIRYSMLRHAGPVLPGSVNSLPFRDASFDVVLFIDLLYIRGVNDSAAVREACRVLRPGGLLVVNVPAFEWLRGRHDVAVHTRRRYRRLELQELLTAHGFAVNQLMYWNALFLPLVFVVRRLLSRERKAAVARSDLISLPRSLNWLLTRLLLLDTWICGTVKVPFGTSVFSVASKVRHRSCS
jgi:SAM-dependent methyltransferase